MQHRAALFAGFVAVCLIAAFHSPRRPIAAVVRGISMVSFLVLYAAAGQPPALRTIARVDLVGLIRLALVVFFAFCG